MKNRVALLAIAIMMIAGSVFSYGASYLNKNQVETTRIYTARTENDESYVAEKEITEKGSRYILVDTRYTTETLPDQKVTIKNLGSMHAPDAREFAIDGEEMKMYLDENSTTYTKNTETRIVQYKGQTVSDFNPGEKKKFKAHGTTVTGDLIKVAKKGKVYEKKITLPASFVGDSEDKYFKFAGSHTLWPLKTEAPVWEGYEEDILDYLKLDKSVYKITGAKWGEKKQNGRHVTCDAEFYATKKVQDYTATYRIPGQGYTADAVYRGYKITATSIYELDGTEQAEESEVTEPPVEEGWSTAQKILFAGASIAIIAGAGATILYYLKKRKNTESEDE